MRKTLLLVEDDVDIQDYLAIVLAPLDLEILRAHDGREALEIIDSGKRIDLILLDVIMPVMDGEAFFRELRVERGSSIPVVLTSVDEAMSGRLKGIGEVQGVFLKGNRGQELARIIRGILG